MLSLRSVCPGARFTRHREHESSIINGDMFSSPPSIASTTTASHAVYVLTHSVSHPGDTASRAQVHPSIAEGETKEMNHSREPATT